MNDVKTDEKQDDRSSSSVDEKFMREAMSEALEALRSEEIPVGCVLVNSKSEIISRGGNKTNKTRNGTEHAEMVAISSVLAAGAPPDIFVGSDLYVTCEPCIMCAAALAKMGVKRVVFGCHNDRFGGNGSILSIQDEPRFFPHRPAYEVTSGVLQEEAIAVFQDFYTSENRRGACNLVMTCVSFICIVLSNVALSTYIFSRCLRHTYIL